MKKKLYWAAIILFAAIFLISAFFLIRYFVEIHQSQKAYDELANIVDDAREQVEATAPTGEVDPGPAMVTVTDPNTGEVMLVLAEYAPIYQLNPDTAGWISIEGTNINFPVLHRPEETDYYLHRDFYGKWNNQGAIYIREQCDPFAPSDNITMYGHRTSASTMFGALQKYKSKDFWQSHQYIRFDTIFEHHTYQILSVFTIESTADSSFLYHLFVDAETDADFTNFVANAKAHSLYETGITAVPGDKLITLSTCDGYGTIGRLVVVAKRIEE